MRKRSFLRLPLPLDMARLRADFDSLTIDDWQASYWSVQHCSVDMVLLRGGTDNGPDDFESPEVADRPILARLPYMASLIDPSGPLGGAKYAFIFRMQPGGVTRIHRDRSPEWFDKYRIHMPIESNPDSILVANGRRGQHFEPGEVWTFHNQELHGVMNGGSVRTHFIMDVPSNPAIERLIDAAEHSEGRPLSDAEWERVQSRPYEMALRLPFETEALSLAAKRQLRLEEYAAASRVLAVEPSMEDRLYVGDLIIGLNGKAVVGPDLDVATHISQTYKPGQSAQLRVLRDGQPTDVVTPPLVVAGESSAA
jgi:hypothetical protein